MMLVLGIIGITRNRFVSQKIWVIIWSIISFFLATLILFAFITNDTMMIDLALGSSFGFVMAIGIHVIHHVIEEFQK